MNARQILRDVASGRLTVGRALSRLGVRPERNLGFARIDIERHRRRGLPEVVFAAGKTPDQVLRIVRAFRDAQHNVLCTRAGRDVYAAVRGAFPAAAYHESARMITLHFGRRPRPSGRVSVVSAGTSDQPVAEEAALTAEWMGARVIRVYDVGVAGLHRLVNHLDGLRASRAVVVVAGMEGALPSVVGGLIDRPVIAVPTSVGYGTSLQGFAALLAMLNTCVPGITVVNIDNGFGAGVAAAMINRRNRPAKRRTRRA